MEMKILCMDWLSKFQCIGGNCPMTCCSAEWKIGLTEQEIANYKKMEHPYAKEFVKMIDQENKRMRTENGVCKALTKDGWCRLVQECGEKSLSATCTQFPRIVKEYGDVVEGTVEIVCPVVAGYLLESKAIAFEFAEENIDKTIQEIDYQIYDSLSLARTYLIETIQAYPGKFISGKVYMIFDVLYQIRTLCNQNSLDQKKVSRILEEYASDEVRHGVFAECEKLAGQYEVKAEVLQKVLPHLKSILIERLLPKLVGGVEAVRKDLKEWLSDTKLFATCLEGFADYQRQNYPLLTDQFLIYSLFLNWINIDLEQFGHLFSVRMLELVLIQTIAMSAWKQSGEVSKVEYEIIIASIDRILSHTNNFNKALANLMFVFGQNNPANVVRILI